MAHELLAGVARDRLLELALLAALGHADGDLRARTYLDHLDPQYLRYYYAAKLNGKPEDLDFNLDDFVHRVDAELINKIANLVSRVVPFVTRQFASRLGQLDASVEPLIDDIRARIPRIRECYETPEGRSIVVLAKERFQIRERELAGATLVPFTAQTRMSGVDMPGRSIRKGAADSIRRWVDADDGNEAALATLVDGVALGGGTPLVVAENGSALGVVHLKDVVKEGLRGRFDELRAMGIRTVMITGDNPLTAKAIADEAGVDDFLAEATPEDKMALIKREQAGGNLVAMTGDGTNDAPALAQADVGVAMNTGTQAAREAGNMVDLDSDPTKLIEIVEIGKQLLITRGSLTTFSIANDVAKYFAIIPAMFAGPSRCSTTSTSCASTARSRRSSAPSSSTRS